MKRRVLLGPLLSLAALIAGAVLLTPSVAAGSVTLKQYGWWLAANHDPTLTAPYSGVGPDAPDLHIAYGPNVDGAENTDLTSPVNGAVAVSAVFWKLGAPVSTDVAPNVPVAAIKLALDTAYTPAAPPQASLLACPSLNPWPDDKAGNWSRKVTYNPGGNCAPGQPDSSNTTFSFTITEGMLKDQGASIDLAIVPGFNAIGLCALPPPAGGGCAADPTNPPQAPWTMDLKPPTADDVALQPVAAGTGIGGGFSIPQLSSASVPSLGGSLPAAGPAAAPPLPAQGPGGTGGQVSRVPTGLAANPAARLSALTRGRLVAAGLLLLLFLGGLLLMGMDVQKLLTPAGQAGGIGRFARPRQGPPLPI